MSEVHCGVDDNGTTGAGGAAVVIRVERGHLASEELAAVTAVLLSRLAAAGRDRGGDLGLPAGQGTGSGPAPHAPQWRPGRPPAAYRSPHSWR